MRNLSSFIASTAAHGEERKAMGAWMAGLFVAVLLLGGATAAYVIGNSIAGPNSGEPPPFAIAEEGL